MGKTLLPATRVGAGALLLSAIATFTLFLSACSGHPAAGKWLPSKENDNNFSALQVQFDGKAEFYIQGSSQAALHCFWQAVSASIIDMQCSAADSEEEPRYQLEIIDGDLGVLKQQGSAIAEFKRKPL